MPARLQPSFFAPCDGDAFYTFDSLGDGIYIRVPDNTGPQYNVILWHLYSKDDPQFKPLIATDGSITKVKAGHLLGYTDNSGAPRESTGPHLHLGLMPVDKTGAPLQPNNGFNGCIDPAPFFNGYYAEDHDSVITNFNTQLSLYQKVVNLFKQILHIQ